MSAIERIEASRARLRLAMAPPPAPASEARDDSWLAKLKHLPAVDLVTDALRDWWSRHPLRPFTLVAVEASDAVVKPLARRHPLALVLVAGVVGAALAWSRPRRWIFRSALFAGLIPQLASQLVSKMPIESWMNVLGAAVSATRGKAATNPTQATATA